MVSVLVLSSDEYFMSVVVSQRERERSPHLFIYKADLN